MIIGLTGGSGTGKSTACEFFKKTGFVIIDSDEVSREVCRKGEACLDEIVEVFGAGVLDDEGNLMRHSLGDIVFNDKEKLLALNEITHKYIIGKIEDIINRNKHKNIVLDAPLLFETGLDKLCHMNICVLSEKENRIRRIILRDGISLEQATARIESQPNDKFYISRCDIAFYNNGDMELLMDHLKEEFGNGKI